MCFLLGYLCKNRPEPTSDMLPVDTLQTGRILLAGAPESDVRPQQERDVNFVWQFKIIRLYGLRKRRKKLRQDESSKAQDSHFGDRSWSESELLSMMIYGIGAKWSVSLINNEYWPSDSCLVVLSAHAAVWVASPTGLIRWKQISESLKKCRWRELQSPLSTDQSLVNFFRARKNPLWELSK